eukprot:3375339-Rhodomonas_salina.2
MRSPVLTERMGLPGIHRQRVSGAISLRACYAMPGTDGAYAARMLVVADTGNSAIRVRAPYLPTRMLRHVRY